MVLRIRGDAVTGESVPSQYQDLSTLFPLDFRLRQQYLVDPKHYFDIDHDIFEKDIFQAWLSSEGRWQLRLCGSPRSGKTLLCARIAAHLEKRDHRESYLVVQLYLGDLEKHSIALNSVGQERGITDYDVEDFLLRAVFRQLAETRLFSLYGAANDEANAVATGDSWSEIKRALVTVNNAILIVDGIEHLSAGLQDTFERLLDVARTCGMRTLVTQLRPSDSQDFRIRCTYSENHRQRQTCAVYRHCSRCKNGDVDVCFSCYTKLRLGCYDPAHKETLLEPYTYRDFNMVRSDKVLQAYAISTLRQNSFKHTRLGRRILATDPRFQRLCERIAQKSEGQLEVAKILLERIFREQTLSVLDEVSDELPEDDQEFCDHVIAQARCRDLNKPALVKRMIAVAAHAVPTLTFNEFIDAIYRRRGMDPTLPQPISRNEVLQMTDGMLAIADNDEGRVNVTSSKLTTFMRDSEDSGKRTMSEICLAYLQEDWLVTTIPEQMFLSSEIYTRHPFLAHISRFVGRHLCGTRGNREALWERLCIPELRNNLVRAAWFANGHGPEALSRDATLLHVAAYMGLDEHIKTMAGQEGMDIHGQDGIYGETALHAACKTGNGPCALALLSLGAVATSCDRLGQTPLDHAVARSNIYLVELLIDHMQLKSNAQTAQVLGRALHTAASHGSCQRTLGVLLSSRHVSHDYKNDKGDTPLLTAVKAGHLRTARSLVRLPEVDVVASDMKGRSLLHLLWDHLSTSIDVIAECLEITQIVIDRVQADTKIESINCQDHAFGRTPLMYIMKAMHKVATSCATSQSLANEALGLIFHASSRRQTDARGRNLVHYAAACGLPELLLQLHESGISVVAPDKLDMTPLHLACQAGAEKCITPLLDLDADPFASDASGQSPIDLAEESDLDMALFDCSEKDDRSLDQASTSIWSALNSDDDVELKHLIKEDPEAVKKVETTWHMNALHLATLERTSAVRLVLQSGLINPTDVDIRGRTPLHHLLSEAYDDDEDYQIDRQEIAARVALLVEHDPMIIDLKDSDDASALDIALTQRDYEIAALLAERNAVITNAAGPLSDWLSYAVAHGQLSIIARIIGAGFDAHGRCGPKLLVQLAYENSSKHKGLEGLWTKSPIDFVADTLAHISIRP
ncbi:Hypothetical protein D9617_18g034020 [Elsinoe fawcettii]|nr:Hypothetical protein D9617_18g034020 [Elsinoe fawcettii]